MRIIVNDLWETGNAYDAAVSLELKIQTLDDKFCKNNMTPF